MFEIEILPRFHDTDCLAHVNNAAVVTWFEEARRPLFRLFTPDLDPEKWRLIVARVEVDYRAQLGYAEPVKVKTRIGRIGNSSMDILQEAWQGGALGAEGRAVLIHFDYAAGKAAPIPDEIREELEKH